MHTLFPYWGRAYLAGLRSFVVFDRLDITSDEASPNADYGDSFTLAHSITLGLSVLDVLSLRPAIAEIIIAFSVVYMAFESMFLLQKGANHSASPNTVRTRIIVTAAFGLLYGFGFSYVLKEIGLGDQIVSALLFFNLGVEAGQLLILAVCFPIAVLLFKRFASVVWAQTVALYIGLIGLDWA